jgi:beta-glucosidase/6-phospho-beta-glucosidase/beta-galactosidase
MPISFPDDFIFGAATSSYQVEGAAKRGSRSRPTSPGP